MSDQFELLWRGKGRSGGRVCQVKLIIPLKKVALSGGAAVTLTAPVIPYGASWGADDTIVFGQPGQGILRVAGAGGTPEVLVSVESTRIAHQPQVLPGGEAVLYTLGTPRLWVEAEIVVEQLATGERTVVIEGGSDARYLPTGHLVYALGETLLAVPFDVERLTVTGSPVPLVEGQPSQHNRRCEHGYRRANRRVGLSAA